MQFRCRIPAGWRFFVPLCNTQHGAYESDSSLHRRLFTDGNFEKNRPRRLRREWPGHGGSCNATANTAAGADAGTNAGRRQRGKGVHDNRPDACGGKTARAAGRCRGGIRRAGIRGTRGACGIGKAAGDSRRGNAGRSAGGLRQPGAFGTAVAQLAAFVAERGFVPVAAGAFVGEHSYSTPGTPIAEGRPDTQDLAEAAAFGARIGQKLAHGETGPIDAAKLREPHTPLLSKLRFIRFVLGYRRRQKRNPGSHCSPRATPHGAPNAAAVSHSVPRRRSRAATNCTPTRRAASAAVHASKAARSAHARSKRLSLPFCRATSPGGNRRNAYVI